ncbi:MAG: transcriptional regulator [Acidobacteria bacterium]|nr:MAG: transcriptional regulator [Acidobacteriota bacterium]
MTQLLPAPQERYDYLKNLLIEAREKARLTQVELASRLHRPQSFVSKIERGLRRVDVIEFLEIAKAIGFSPTKFLEKLIRNK